MVRKTLTLIFAVTLASALTWPALGQVQTHAASDLSVEAKPSGEVFIRGRCSEVQSVQDALITWKQKLSEPMTSGNLSAMEQTANSQKCRLEVSTLLPKFIRENLGSQKWAGPNCWNTVLLANKIISGKRFTVASEFVSWMNSPLCRKVPDGGRPPVGAIIAVRDHQNQDHHAFVAIRDNFVFEKIGPSASEEYRLVSARLALAPYQSQIAKGTLKLETFDCQALAPFLGSAENVVSSELLILMKEIRTLSNLLSPWSHVDQMPTEAQLQDWKSQNVKLTERLSDELSQNSVDLQTVSWFGETLLNELKSQRTQIQLFEMK